MKLSIVEKIKGLLYAEVQSRLDMPIFPLQAASSKV